jgi:hypothetical protein
MCFAQGIVRLTLQTSHSSFSASLTSSSSKLQSQMTFRLCATFLELWTH